MYALFVLHTSISPRQPKLPICVLISVHRRARRGPTSHTETVGALREMDCLLLPMVWVELGASGWGFSVAVAAASSCAPTKPAAKLIPKPTHPHKGRVVGGGVRWSLGDAIHTRLEVFFAKRART